MDIFLINLYIIFAWYFLTRFLRKDKRNIIFCVAICIQFIIIVGLRDLGLGDSGMVSDVRMYEQHFNAVKDLPFYKVWGYNDGKSGLFYFLLSCFSKSGCSFPFFVFIYISFYTVVFSWFVYNYSEAPLMSYLIFLGHAGFTASYYLFRQCIAMALVLIAFHYLIRRNNWKMWLFVLIAFLIHYTVLAVIPFFFLSSIKFNKKIFVFTLFALAVIVAYRNSIGLYLTNIFAENALAYYDKKDGVGILALTCLSFLILFVLFKFKEIRNRQMTKLDQACLYGLIFATIYQFGSSFAYTFTRLNLYFFQMIIVLAIPNIFSMRFLKTKNKVLYAPISLIGNVVIACLMIFLYFSALKSEGLIVN